MSAITMQQQEQEYFLVTEGELDQIKNDCAFPETLNCDGCEYAGDFDSTKASGVGCMFKGANVLIDEVMKRPLLKEHDVAIRNAVLDGLGVLRGEDARRFNEQLDHPEPLTPEARDLVMQAKEIAKKERMALDDRDRLIREDERRIGRIVLEKADKAIERQKRSNIGASIAWFKGMSLAQDILASLYTNGDEPE